MVHKANLYPVNDDLSQPPIEAGHPKFFHLLDLVEEFAHAGRIYRAEELSADNLSGRQLQMNPAEAALEAGMAGTVYEDKKRGEDVRAVSYSHHGITLANPAFQAEAANSEAVLLIARRTDRSLFEAHIDFLANETIRINGTCWLENPRLHVRGNANREFARRWGLESAWDKYVGKGLIGQRADFTAAPTLAIVESTLKTIQDNTETPF